MRPRALSHGHALALLLWMIAGMSLMVTAVIHLARDDIGMAELRLNEAKSRAMARGLAYLAARDSGLRSALIQPAPGVPGGGDATQKRNGSPQQFEVFTEQYEVAGMRGTVELLPAGAFVSLNTATEEELFRLFLALGEAESEAAYEMAVSVVGYRDLPRQATRELGNHSGFRYREELLAVNGMKRSVYDRVKDFVHVNNTVGLDKDLAPERLSSIYTDAQSGSDQLEGSASQASVTKSSGATRQVQGPITFESIYRHKAAMLRGASVNAAMVEVTLPNGHSSFFRVWIDQAGKQISRVETISEQPETS